MAIKRLKLTVKLEMDPDEQEIRRKVHESLPLPEFAKDAYIYRIGMDAHLKAVEARRKAVEKPASPLDGNAG